MRIQVSTFHAWILDGHAPKFRFKQKKDGHAAKSEIWEQFYLHD
jgi:hypothetical protein